MGSENNLKNYRDIPYCHLLLIVHNTKIKEERDYRLLRSIDTDWLEKTRIQGFEVNLGERLVSPRLNFVDKSS